LELYYLWTRDKMLQAISFTSRAIELDPRFAEAHLLKGIALTQLYRLWDRNPKYLAEAEALFIKSKHIKPRIVLGNALIALYLLQHRYADAERVALKSVESSADDYYAHFMLGYFNNNAGRAEQAIPAYEEAIRLRPDYRMSYWNLVEILDRTGQNPECAEWSRKALPLFERWIALNSEDQFARAQYGTLLLYAGDKDRALKTVAPLIASSEADGLALYTIAVMYMHLGDTDAAMQTLDRAVAAGFSHIELLKSDPNFAPLADSPDYKKLIERISGEMS
jgi:tetratricopeptide (TPR) repeat protein